MSSSKTGTSTSSRTGEWSCTECSYGYGIRRRVAPAPRFASSLPPRAGQSRAIIQAHLCPCGARARAKVVLDGEAQKPRTKLGSAPPAKLGGSKTATALMLRLPLQNRELLPRHGSWRACGGLLREPGALSTLHNANAFLCNVPQRPRRSGRMRSIRRARCTTHTPSHCFRV